MHKLWILLHQWLFYQYAIFTCLQLEFFLIKYSTIPNNNSKQLLLVNVENILNVLNLFIFQLTYCLAANRQQINMAEGRSQFPFLREVKQFIYPEPITETRQLSSLTHCDRFAITHANHISTEISSIKTHCSRTVIGKGKALLLQA
jgi:hypothetical protein